tara:strand:- start:873 stop:1280 length:408 start_codon:yes stop_codon:yes gene_type:complete
MITAKVVDKDKFAERYGGVVSRNMSEVNIDKYANFIIEHSFKNVRIQVETPKRSKSTSGYYNPDKVNIGNVEGWTEMSELEKFRILLDKFDLKTIEKEWLDVLPTIKKLLPIIKELSTNDRDEILKDLENEENDE